MNEENNRENLPDNSDIIVPERMDDAEVEKTAPEADTETPGFYFKKVVFTRNPDGSQYTRVESSGDGDPNYIMPKAPVISTWLCLIGAWLLLGSPVPFTVFLGVPLNLAALVLALVCFTRGSFFTGISVMGLGTVGSVIVYLVGILRFLTF